MQFEQILLMTGHAAEVNGLAISKSGGYLLSCSTDRTVRVWERTRDMVFVEEEREVRLKYRRARSVATRCEGEKSETISI